MQISVPKMVYSQMKARVESKRKKVEKEVKQLKEMEATLKSMKVIKR